LRDFIDRILKIDLCGEIFSNYEAPVLKHNLCERICYVSKNGFLKQIIPDEIKEKDSGYIY